MAAGSEGDDVGGSVERADSGNRLDVLIELRRRDELSKLAFREAAVDELIELRGHLRAGRLSQKEYDAWETQVRLLGWDPKDVTNEAMDRAENIPPESSESPES